jgi:hypothetical protein
VLDVVQAKEAILRLDDGGHRFRHIDSMGFPSSPNAGRREE